MASRIGTAALAVVLLLCARPVPAGSEVLRLGSDVWPPFTDAEGRLRVAISLVHAALERSGVQTESVIEEDFAVVLRALREGELDGSAAIWRTPERESFLLFSEPYLENRLVLLGRKGADLSARSLSELAGKRVAIVEGYGYSDALDRTSGPDYVEGKSDQANLRKLLAGEVDYLLADDLLIHDFFERYGDRAERLLAVSRFPLLRRPLHLALRRDLAGAAERIAEFDEVIEVMIADGTYGRILGVSWLWADVDDDGQPEFVLGGERAGTEEPEDAYVVVGPDEPPASPKGRRYYVDGKMYESWQQVPPSYRVRELETASRPRAGALLFEW